MHKKWRRRRKQNLKYVQVLYLRHASGSSSLLSAQSTSLSQNQLSGMQLPFVTHLNCLVVHVLLAAHTKKSKCFKNKNNQCKKNKDQGKRGEDWSPGWIRDARPLASAFCRPRLRKRKIAPNWRETWRPFYFWLKKWKKWLDTLWRHNFLKEIIFEGFALRKLREQTTHAFGHRAAIAGKWNASGSRKYRESISGRY